MKRVIVIFFIFPLFSFGQILYNPQDLYDSPGGLFDKDSLRVIELEFENLNYHSYLVNSWYYNPDERIPATLTLNGTVYDSIGCAIKVILPFVSQMIILTLRSHIILT